VVGAPLDDTAVFHDGDQVGIYGLTEPADDRAKAKAIGWGAGPDAGTPEVE
jgi:hypothetical protein